MISGQQALMAIERSAGELRSQEAALDTALRSADEQIARLRSERTALFRQLAQVRLDAFQKEKVVSQLDRAEQDAMRLIAQEQQRLGELSQRLEECGRRVHAAQEERHAAMAKVASAVEALETLQAAVEPKTRATQAWTAQKQAVDAAQAVAEAADAKARDSEADREQKRKPYEADPLFMYLWTRKFGTAEDRSGPLARFFDRKVAILIGYADARANFTMLNEIPTRLRQHAEACKAAAEAQREKLVVIERAALDEAGSQALENDLETARAALAAAEQRLEEAQAALKAVDEERQALLVDDDASAYRRAIDVLSQADAQLDTRQLMMKAAMTMTGADDAIVRQIAPLDQRLQAAEQQVITLRRQAQALAQRRLDLEQQRDAFRRQGYDGPMSQFSNDRMLSDVLAGIVQGAVQGAVLGNVLRGGYSQRPPRADSSFGGGGGFTLPDLGGGWGGGGGGGFGGNDFRTGGGF
jgi:chromosome segregation ATPase